MLTMGSLSLMGSPKPVKHTPGSALCSPQRFPLRFIPALRSGTSTGTKTLESSRFPSMAPLNSSFLSGLWMSSPVWRHGGESISISYIFIALLSPMISSHNRRLHSEEDGITTPTACAAGSGSFQCALRLVMGEKTEQQTAQPLGSHGADHQATVPALLHFMLWGWTQPGTFPKGN